MFTYQESLLIASNLEDKDLDNFLLLDHSVQKKVVKVLSSTREASAETSTEPQISKPKIKKIKKVRSRDIVQPTFRPCKSKKAKTWGYDIKVSNEVSHYLAANMSAKSISEVTEYISSTYHLENSKKLFNAVQTHLGRMVKIGKVLKISRGKYKWKKEEPKPYYDMIKEFFEKNKGTAFSIQGLVSILTEEYYEILAKVDEKVLIASFKKIVDHLYDQKFVSQYVDPNGNVLYFFVGPATT